MIDLRKKGLPNSIEKDGKSFLINTDFREWLKFGKALEENNITVELLTSLYVYSMPSDGGLNELIKFYTNENITPAKNDSTTSERVLDFVEDGEYIVGSFMQSYNIDLTSCDMHWHLFKALFLSLPDDSKIKNIMFLRGWHKDKRDQEQMYKDARATWSFPKISSEEEALELEEINKLFYNT